MRTLVGGRYASSSRGKEVGIGDYFNVAISNISVFSSRSVPFLLHVRIHIFLLLARKQKWNASLKPAELAYVPPA